MTLSLRRLQRDRGVFYALLAVAYGVLAAVAETVYVLISGDEAWTGNAWAAHVFLYGWLAAFVALGIRMPAHRAKLFLSGVIPIGLQALAFLFAWPIHIPTVVLMVLAMYHSRLQITR